MAKKAVRSTLKTDNSSFRGFLNINLTAEDTAVIKSTAYDNAAWQADLDKWVDNGFKFTFSHDDYNHCLMVIGARQDKGHEDAGILLSARGSTCLKAFKQWIYIQTRLIGEATWTECLKPDNSMVIDD